MLSKPKLAIILSLFAVGSIGFWFFSKSRNVSSITEQEKASAPIAPSEVLTGCALETCPKALNSPVFASASEASFLDNSDVILGINYNNTVRAYPQKIISRHILINEILNEEPILITYCPLCGTGVAYKSNILDRSLIFSITGNIFEDDVILVDDYYSANWLAASGEIFRNSVLDASTSLEAIPITTTTWEVWYQSFPQTEVLVGDSALGLIYDKEFLSIPKFDISTVDETLDSPVFGVVVEGNAKAYFIDSLLEALAAESYIEDDIGANKIGIALKSSSDVVFTNISEAKNVNALETTWKAWNAFYPYTEVYLP